MLSTPPTPSAMQLQRLSLRNFRNFEQVDCAIAPRFTVFWGENGAGKTNLLEAIYFLSTLRSFRVSEQSLLIRGEESEAQLASRCLDQRSELHDDLRVNLRRNERGTRKSIYLNQKAQKSALSVYGRLPTILFTPEDLGVIRGSPSQRRQFMDRVLFAQDRNHIADIQHYEKLLRSRNRLLKEARSPNNRHDALFSTYEEGMATVGARIWQRRVQLIQELQQDYQNDYQRIQGPGTSPEAQRSIELRYHSKLAPEGSCELPEAPEEQLKIALKEGRAEHILRGSTRCGPHLDDLLFFYEGKKAPQIASQGQLRAMVLAFKIAELELARRRGQSSILLLDDVSSEFDPLRNEHLFDLIAERVEQCIVTTTDPQFLRIAANQRRDHQIRNGSIAVSD